MFDGRLPEAFTRDLLRVAAVFAIGAVAGAAFMIAFLDWLW